MAADSDDDDFFAVRSGPIAFGASLRETAEDRRIHEQLCQEVVDVGGGGFDDDADLPTVVPLSGRRRRRQKDSGSSATKKKELHNDVQLLSSEDEADSREDSLSLSPETEPSYSYSAPIIDIESQKLLQAADFAVYNSRAAAFSRPSSHLDTSYNEPETMITSPVSTQMTLRVRCKSKVYKYNIGQDDPLSLLVSQLAQSLNVVPTRIILQHKSTDLRTSYSPKDLNLSSVDILDAFVLDQSATTSSPPHQKQPDTFAIKIQTASNKSVTYNVNKTQPLEHTLKRFAAELGHSLKDMLFTFDGEKISGKQSAQDLDMEMDDIIDARIIKK